MSYACIETSPVPNSNAVHRMFATYCREFRSVLPRDLFTDARDGDIRSMTLTLTYKRTGTENTNGPQQVSKHEWVQLNTENRDNQFIYGFVTPEIDSTSTNRTYFYDILCTDSSGRTARKTIQIQIYGSAPSPLTNTITLGLNSLLPAELPDVYVLSILAGRLGSYMDPSSTAARLFVSHFKRDSVIRFSYCQLACSQSNMDNLYTRFQSIKYRTQPRVELKNHIQKVVS